MSEPSRYLPEVPSPTLAATEGWLRLWCVRDPRVDSIISRTCGLLRLGVKRFASQAILGREM